MQPGAAGLGHMEQALLIGAGHHQAHLVGVAVQQYLYRGIGVDDSGHAAVAVHKDLVGGVFHLGQNHPLQGRFPAADRAAFQELVQKFGFHWIFLPRVSQIEKARRPQQAWRPAGHV